MSLANRGVSSSTCRLRNVPDAMSRPSIDSNGRSLTSTVHDSSAEEALIGVTVSVHRTDAVTGTR